LKTISNIIILLCILINFSYANPPASLAATGDQPTAIAAILGDQVISVYDLKQRVQLIVNSQPHPVHINDVQAIIQKALDELLEEKTLEKEATKQSIFATEGEIQELINDLCKHNHIPEGQFAAAMKSRNIPIETLKSQLKGQLIKSKIVREIILPKVHVTEKEIYETLHTNTNSEIDIDLKKVHVTFTDDKDLEKKRRDANDLRAKTSNCTNLDQVVTRFSSFTIEPQNLKAKEIQEPLRNEILNTEVNKPTKIIKMNNALEFYVICSKKYIGLTSQDQHNIHEMLMQNKLSIQISLYLAQLRKRSHIDIKTENLRHLTFSPKSLNVVR
jgi:hypothetical protein